MVSKNDITGNEIKTKTSSDKYREGWDRIFGKKKDESKDKKDKKEKKKPV
jgi:hypothetical protein